MHKQMIRNLMKQYQIEPDASETLKFKKSVELIKRSQSQKLQQYIQEQDSRIFLEQIKNNTQLASDLALTRKKLRELTPGILMPNNLIEEQIEELAPLYLVLVKSLSAR